MQIVARFVLAVRDPYLVAVPGRPRSALKAQGLRPRVRDELACNDAQVGAVAHQWGSSNAGRLASAYLRRFGVTPVATRRRYSAKG